MNTWYLTSEMCHHSHPQSEKCHVCRGFFLQTAFALPVFWANWEQGNDCRKMLCWNWSSMSCWQHQSWLVFPQLETERVSSGLPCSHTGFFWCCTVSSVWILKTGRSVLLRTNLACFCLCSFQEMLTSSYPKGMSSQESFFCVMFSDLGLFPASWLGSQAEWAAFCMKLCTYI